MVRYTEKISGTHEKKGGRNLEIEEMGRGGEGRGGEGRGGEGRGGEGEMGDREVRNGGADRGQRREWC